VPPNPAPDTPAGKLFGFNDNSIRARQISAADSARLTAGAGANVQRLAFDWRWAEPERDTYRLSDYDAIYREMTARGVRPLFILIYAPSWALDPSEACDQWRADCRVPPGRAHYGEWREIAALIARRYPDAAGLEVWNEPNELSFWRPAPDPARYAEILREAYDAVKAVNPALPIVGGAMTNRQAREGANIAMGTFLQGVYRAGGRGHMDAIGFHPYPWALTNELLRKSVAEVRAVRDAAGDSGLPLWATEVGLSTTGPAPFRFSEEQQAVGLVSIYRELMAMPDVQAVMVHTLLGADLDPSISREPGYGIVRPDRSPKPAYCALARERGVACG
jgi:hypothetical protein